MPADVGTESDPTQYANYGGSAGGMYYESPVMYDETILTVDADVQTEGLGRNWPGTIALAGGGLAAAFLLAFVTLNMVRSTDPTEATPPTPIIHSVTNTPAERGSIERDRAVQPSTQTITIAPIAPTSQRPETATVGPEPHRPATITVTTTHAQPATMTNPLEPPPATMTNPLEPPPATMTNPLEPPLATMTNPLEPLIGASGESAE